MSEGKLSPAQRELLAEFAQGPYDDRHVNPRYRKTADILVERGLLRGLSSGWYEITAVGKAFAREDEE